MKNRRESEDELRELSGFNCERVTISFQARPNSSLFPNDTYFLIMNFTLSTGLISLYSWLGSHKRNRFNADAFISNGPIPSQPHPFVWISWIRRNREVGISELAVIGSSPFNNIDKGIEGRELGWADILETFFPLLPSGPIPTTPVDPRREILSGLEQAVL